MGGKVKGTLSELIVPKSQEFSNAIDAVGGGKLTNLVVDNHSTGKHLIENKKLTIITKIGFDRLALLNQSFIYPSG